MEELLFEVDVNVNVLFRCARKRSRSENVFPTALIVDFAQFYSAALEGILLIDPEIYGKSLGYLEKDTNVLRRGGAFLGGRGIDSARILNSSRKFYPRCLVNLAELRTSRPLALFREYYGLCIRR